MRVNKRAWHLQLRYYSVDDVTWDEILISFPIQLFDGMQIYQFLFIHCMLCQKVISQENNLI